MLVVLTALMVFLTVSLGLLALTWRSEDPVGERVRSLARYRGQSGRIERTAPFAQRVLIPILTNLADMISSILPNRLLDSVRRKLVMAGGTLTLNTFLVVWALVTVTPPALYFFLLLLSGFNFGPQQFLLLLILAGVGAAVPYLVLHLRVRKRQTIIWKSLPDAFDLVTTMVEAGLGLDAALSRVGEKVPGPFAAEVQTTIREVAMGKPRRQALLDLVERTGVDDLSVFINAIVQAEQMGVSIASVLRTQCDELRVRRKQLAEQRARRAAVLLIFPIIFCNLPALFIVAFGPAALQLPKLMSGG
jgi:tight adherence protein C